MDRFRRFFGAVQKPIRYTGGEVNQVKKDPEKVRIKFALCFPDIYEIGMSHTGGKIIYKILNDQEDILCERVFAPWVDAREALKRFDLKLFSLENRIELCRFDVVGFSIQYEMGFPTIIEMLRLGGIEPLQRLRDESSPLIIAGGPAVFNPEPISDVFDLFYLGDAEKGLIELLRRYKDLKEKGIPQKALLQRLSEIEGVYVPSLFKIEYDGLYLKNPVDKKVKRSVSPLLLREDYPDRQIVTLTEAVQDRFVVEIQRGCTHGCRFCFAGYIYRPVRQRSGDDIYDIVTKGVKNSGFQEISFLSLSASDYPYLKELLKRLNEHFSPLKISLSLPSLRVDGASPEVLKQLLRVKKTGITIAPEVGSERMRRRINKNITDEDVIRSAEAAFASGWELIKLYFMIGLPDETEEDILAICDLSYRVLDVAKKYIKRPEINITISPFVPKPHTPLQWEAMEDEKGLIRKLTIIRKRLSHPAFKIKKANISLSRLEALFSRGDRRILDVILKAVDKGAYLDAWADLFDASRYLDEEKAFYERYKLRFDDYLGRREFNRPLAWDMISTGVSDEFLIAENERYHSGIATEDCLTMSCSNCGVCDSGLKNLSALAPSNSSGEVQRSSLRVEDQQITYYRMQYAKEGDMIFASQLDLINIFRKALMMSGLPLLFRGEYNPRVDLSTGPALPVGVISSTEFIDFTLSKTLPVDYVSKSLMRFLPEGIRIVNMIYSLSKLNSISQMIKAARFDVYPDGHIDKSRVEKILTSSEIKITRHKEDVVKEVDAKRYIHDIRFEDGHLSVYLLYIDGGTVNIFDVLNILGVSDKSDVFVRKDKVYFSMGEL